MQLKSNTAGTVKHDGRFQQFYKMEVLNYPGSARSVGLYPVLPNGHQATSQIEIPHEMLPELIATLQRVVDHPEVMRLC